MAKTSGAFDRVFTIPRTYTWEASVRPGRYVMFVDDGYIEVANAIGTGIWFVNVHDLPLYDMLDKMEISMRRDVLDTLAAEYASRDSAAEAAERVVTAVVTAYDNKR